MQKKYYLLISLVFGTMVLGFAQQFDWVRKVDIRTDNNHNQQPWYWDMNAKVETDPAGNIFVTGHFKDTVVFENQMLISKGGFDIFLARYNSSGGLDWVKQIHGINDQMVSDMDIDRNGNIYLTGQFSETLSLSETILTGEGAFVLKLNNAGEVILVKKIDGIQTVDPLRIIATASDEFFLAGALYGTVDFGCSTLTAGPTATKFIARYNSTGDCQWANKFLASYLFGLTFDGYNLYMTGGFVQDAVFGEFTITANFQDIYVAKCDLNGNWGWAKGIGGAAEEQGRDIEIDHSGNIIVTGFFAQTVNFGTTTLTSSGASDIFIASYDEFGGNNWAIQAGGGNGNQYAFDIDVNASGHLIISGSIIDETHFGGTTITPNGEKSYVAAYDDQGNSLWALASTGLQGDRALDVATSHSDIYMLGTFFSDGQYSFGQNAVQANSNEIYISKLKNPSQRFTRIVPDNGVGVQYSHNAWIDFDGDSDLDVLTTGANSTNDLRTNLYENLGNNKFRPAQSPFSNLPQYSETEINFLNINRDERIDIALMGRRIGNTNRISLLENYESGFVDKGSLPDFGSADGYGTVSVGDVNKDGQEDIFVSGITGYSNGTPTLGAFLYFNTNGVFTKTNSSLFKALYLSTSRFADLDNDQDLDLIVCGTQNVSNKFDALIYINDGVGNFSESSIALTKLIHSSIDVFDIDGDHDLDVLLSGLDEQLQPRTSLYENSSGSFIETVMPEGIKKTGGGSVKWGDYDNDGDADILSTGGKTLSIFINAGGQFAELIDPAFEAVGIGQASWGDYDNDSDLDILVSGSTYFDNELVPTLYILKNEMTAKNERPGIPADFNIASIDEKFCTLQWNASTDDHTPSSSVTYNISIEEIQNGRYVLHPLSESAEGKRMVSQQGNVMLNTSWDLKNMQPGTYAIKVQAIDGGYLGSLWSAKKIFYAGTLAAPANLTATSDNGGIQLSWKDNSVNEQYFIIERRLNGGEFLKLDSVLSNVNVYLDKTDDFGSFTYRVYAGNPTQISAPTNEANVQITGIKPTFGDNISIHPNPGTDRVTIKVDDQISSTYSVQIINSTGLLLVSEQSISAHDGNMQIDIAGLPAGMYVVKIKSAEATRVIKLVKR